jgi:carbon monoxide dehydrogenase subunit G
MLGMLYAHGKGHDDAGLDLDSALHRDPIVLRLKGVTQVDRDPEWVFSELHDPETLLACVPGGSLTRLVGPGKFEARIAVGAGPFKFMYSGTGQIIDSDPKSRTASMTLNGHPASNMPDIRMRMAMAVGRHPRGTEIKMTFRIVISSRAGLLSRTWIDLIACDLLDRTIHRVKERLEKAPVAPGPVAA